MAFKFELGDKVRDKVVRGIRGIVTGRTEYLFGLNNQYHVESIESTAYGIFPEERLEKDDE